VKSLEDELAALAVLDRPALAARWQEVFGCAAPPRCQPPLLRGALAWRLQLGQTGGTERTVKRLIRSLHTPTARPELSSGTRLVREWQGVTHHVLVTNVGFEYAGNFYKSLTAIARRITGTGRSGPLFFGLRS
jgi:hypothetical protein